MSEETTVADVKWLLSTEGSFIRLNSDALGNGNMQKGYNQIQESIGKLTHTAAKLKSLIVQRDKIVVADAHL